MAVNDSEVTNLPDSVELSDAVAIPLVSLARDQLVRHRANEQKGEVALMTGALEGVGRIAVHSAKKTGAQVIAGVGKRELDDARSLGVAHAMAIDDVEATEKLQSVHAIVDTVGGQVATKLLAKVKQGDSFVYSSPLPDGAKAQQMAVKTMCVTAPPDPSKARICGRPA